METQPEDTIDITWVRLVQNKFHMPKQILTCTVLYDVLLMSQN